MNGRRGQLKIFVAIEREEEGLPLPLSAGGQKREWNQKQEAESPFIVVSFFAKSLLFVANCSSRKGAGGIAHYGWK